MAKFAQDMRQELIMVLFIFDYFPTFLLHKGFHCFDKLKCEKLDPTSDLFCL